MCACMMQENQTNAAQLQCNMDSLNSMVMYAEEQVRGGWDSAETQRVMARIWGT